MFFEVAKLTKKQFVLGILVGLVFLVVVFFLLFGKNTTPKFLKLLDFVPFSSDFVVSYRPDVLGVDLLAQGQHLFFSTLWQGWLGQRLALDWSGVGPLVLFEVPGKQSEIVLVADWDPGLSRQSELKSSGKVSGYVWQEFWLPEVVYSVRLSDRLLAFTADKVGLLEWLASLDDLVSFRLGVKNFLTVSAESHVLGRKFPFLQSVQDWSPKRVVIKADLDQRGLSWSTSAWRWPGLESLQQAQFALAWQDVDNQFDFNIFGQSLGFSKLPSFMPQPEVLLLPEGVDNYAWGAPLNLVQLEELKKDVKVTWGVNRGLTNSVPVTYPDGSEGKEIVADLKGVDWWALDDGLWYLGLASNSGQPQDLEKSYYRQGQKKVFYATQKDLLAQLMVLKDKSEGVSYFYADLAKVPKSSLKTGVELALDKLLVAQKDSQLFGFLSWR